MSDGAAGTDDSVLNLDANKGAEDKGAAGDKSIIDAKAGEGDASKAEAAKAEEAKAAQAIEAAAAKLELKLPDGVDPKDPSLAPLKKLFAETGLDTPKAQKLYDAHQAGIKQALETHAKAQEKAGEEWVANQRAQWRKDLRADKDFGGANFEKSAAAVNRAWAKYGDTPGLKEHLSRGSIDEPSINRLLKRIGDDLAEDSTTVTKSGPAARSDKADLQKMFDKSPELFA